MVYSVLLLLTDSKHTTAFARLTQIAKMKTKTNLLVLPTVENIEEIISKSLDTINLTKGRYSNLEFRFKDNTAMLLHEGIDINNFSTVWLGSYWGSRDLAYAVKLYLDHFNISHTYVEKSTSKITDQIQFVFNDIPTPDMFFLNSPELINYVEEIEEVCGYPVIIKDIKGSRGKDSLYINNRQELITSIALLPKDRRFCFQKYIPNEFDWGVLVVNGKVVSAEKSYHASSEFRNNACNGAKEIFVEVKDIPAVIKNIAIRASKSLKLSWSRSDIIVDKITQIPYLLEVNRSPGITSGSTEVSGAQRFLKMHLASIQA